MPFRQAGSEAVNPGRMPLCGVSALLGDGYNDAPARLSPYQETSGCKNLSQEVVTWKFAEISIWIQ